MPSHYFSYPRLTPVVFSFVGTVCYTPFPNVLLYSTYLMLFNFITLPTLPSSISCQQTNNKQTEIICYFLSLSFKYSQQALVKHTQYIKRDVFIVVMYIKSIFYQQENVLNFDILSCQTCF